MRQLSALSLFLAVSGAQATTQTLDCGRLLDVKAGVWRDKVSIVVESGNIKSVGPMTPGPDHVDLSAHSCMPGFIDAWDRSNRATPPTSSPSAAIRCATSPSCSKSSS